MRVVISQPMLFPWVGMLEQIRLADIYVHYTDVQFSKGSFANRVQVKTPTGMKWMTVPLEGLSLGQRIAEVRLSTRADWRRSHLDLLSQSYESAPHKSEMLAIVRRVYDGDHATVGELGKASIVALCQYFGLASHCRFVPSEGLGTGESSSARVLSIVKELGGTTYITGHGAKDYLDHGMFEAAGVRVEYMAYRKVPYRQLHGEFTPFVSTLDLVSNEGPAGERFIQSTSVYWKDFLNG